MPSKGLGRGLSALLGDAPETSSSSGVMLRLPAIEPNPDQPRKAFDKEGLEALAASIKENGLIQPLVVRPIEDGRYRLIAGERRWRACRMAGLREAPAVILEADELRAAQLTLIENLQREDLNPLEEAKGFDTLISAFGLTQEDAAKRVGISRSALTNTLRLLSLDEYCRGLLEEGKISAGHARALLSLENEKLRRQAADACLERALSVRQLEALVKRLSALAEEERPESAHIAVDYAAALSRRLSESLGRRITVRPGAKKGKIEIEYYGNDDLDTLVALLENKEG